MAKEEKDKTKKIPEIFEIEKKGKTKIKEIEAKQKIEEASPKEVKKMNKQLGNILLGIIITIAIFGLVIFINYNSVHFKYKEMKFNVVKFCDSRPCLVTYQTAFPAEHNGQKIDYNFYLRNDPRKLEKIPFKGNITLLKRIIIKHEGEIGEFNCEGDGVIGVANIVNLYSFLGADAKVVNKSNPITCDNLFGRYMFIDIVEGNETKIEQYGPACYRMYVHNCEILPATERFMTESFVKVHEELK